MAEISAPCALPLPPKSAWIVFIAHVGVFVKLPNMIKKDRRLMRLSFCLQRISCACKIAAGFKVMHDFKKMLLVGLIEPTDGRAIDIQHADHFSIVMERNDDLGIGCAVAGDVAGKLMNVIDKLRFVL